MSTVERAPGMDFIFWRHIDANTPSLIGTLRAIDPDVILLESSPVTPKRHKRIAEGLANLALGGELTKAQLGALKYQLGEKILSFTYKDLYTHSSSILDGDAGGDDIIHAFHDTGKILGLLDANTTEHPEVQEAINSVEREAGSFNAERLSQDDPDIRVLTEPVRFLKDFGNTIRMRDEIAVGQIQHYRSSYPNARIAIVYGFNHSGIYHPFARNINNKRQFIDTTRDTGKPGIKHLSMPQDQVIRAARFGKEVPDTLLNQVFLENAITSELLAQVKEADNVRGQPLLSPYAQQIKDEVHTIFQWLGQSKFRELADDLVKNRDNPETHRKLQEIMRQYYVDKPS